MMAPLTRVTERERERAEGRDQGWLTRGPDICLDSEVLQRLGVGVELLQPTPHGSSPFIFTRSSIFLGRGRFFSHNWSGGFGECSQWRDEEVPGEKTAPGERRRLWARLLEP